MFDEDDLIVYSPGEPYNDENFQDPEPMELFLQNENCHKTSLLSASSDLPQENALPQCRECTKDTDCDKYSCRFYEFRKIEKCQDGSFRVAGFLDPHIDPTLAGK
jgi:hypothetical protein